MLPAITHTNYLMAGFLPAIRNLTSNRRFVTTKIVSTADASNAYDTRTIYTVELLANNFVDVMHKHEKTRNERCGQATNGLFYVMQNSDGSHVFDADGHPKAVFIDELSIIAYTKHYIEQSAC